jgi:hypothetical protein
MQNYLFIHCLFGIITLHFIKVRKEGRAKKAAISMPTHFQRDFVAYSYFSILGIVNYLIYDR